MTQVSVIDDFQRLTDKRQLIFRKSENLSGPETNIDSINWIHIDSKDSLEDQCSKDNNLGIYLVKDYNGIKGESRSMLCYDILKYLNSKSKLSKPTAASIDLLVRPYINDLYLHGGYRCDLKCFAIIASVKPLTVIFNRGYACRSSVLYDASKRLHRMTYSTRFDDQLLNSEFENVKKDLIVPVSEIEDQLLEVEKKAEFWTIVKSTVERVITDWHNRLESTRKGIFSIVSFDFLLSSRLQPSLASVSDVTLLHYNNISHAHHIANTTISAVTTLNGDSKICINCSCCDIL